MGPILCDPGGLVVSTGLIHSNKNFYHHFFWKKKMSCVPLTPRAVANSLASPTAKLGDAEGDVSTAEKIHVPKRRKTDPLGTRADEEKDAGRSMPVALPDSSILCRPKIAAR